MAYNKDRAERFKKLRIEELRRIANGGTLSAAAARYELKRRAKLNKK